MQKICLLGATGSVGSTVLRAIRKFPDSFRLHSISVHNNISQAEKICAEFHPELCLITGMQNAGMNHFGKTQVIYGTEKLSELTSATEVDIVVTALVGATSFLPTVSAIQAEKKIAFANKETLVTFGPIIMNELKKSKARLIPVDSEHNALFQLLEKIDQKDVDSIYLTASGGSFRDYPIDRLSSVSIDDALKHPTWSMGKKITIDSATMANKGLEVIEAHFLFNISYDKIRVVIHPESIVHGIVMNLDGSARMYCADPDMIYPVVHALQYPLTCNERLTASKPENWNQFNFYSPDPIRYPALQLAYQAGRAGGTGPAIYNAANEVAVSAFLDGKIRFTEIASVLECSLNEVQIENSNEVEIYTLADRNARLSAENRVKKEACLC